MTKKIIFSLSLISVFFIQCVHREKETEPSIQTVVEMPEFPPIEDPEPSLEAPSHMEMFAANLSVDPLKEMETFIIDGRLTPLIQEVLESLEHTKVEDPDLRNLLQTATVAMVLDVVNPEKPLDPLLESFLKEMLELEGLNLPLPELPEINLIATDPGTVETGGTAGQEQPSDEQDADCVQEIRERYESGFRGCGLDHDSNVQAINTNYQRRAFEAEERLLRRNEEVRTLSGEKLLVVGDLLREINKLIQRHPGVENYEEVRLKLSYFGLVYAYYIRINLPVLSEYALAVNQAFYEYELETFAKIRDNKLEEASALLQDCIDRVNDLIAKEVESTCR